MSDSIDAAWAEAEAALPDGWRIHQLYSVGDEWGADAAPTPAYEHVPAHTFSYENGGIATRWLGRGAKGPTPAAALLALAARLSTEASA